MLQSSYIDIYKLFAEGVISQLKEQADKGGEPTERKYRHKQMLKPEFSVDGRFDTISYISHNFMADVVSMNSPLPLKSRDSIGKSSGEIPKMGVMYQLFEDELDRIDNLALKGASASEIASKLLANNARAIKAIDERIEAMFLQGLSSGYTEVADPDNVGTPIRLDFGYLEENKFGVKTLWSSANTATPLDDIDAVMQKAEADGNIITDVYLDPETFAAFVGSEQVRSYYKERAHYNGEIKRLSLDQLNAMLEGDDDYGFRIHKIRRVVKSQRDGKTKTHRPWEAGKVIFTCSDKVGVLAYASLTEENHPVQYVEYHKGGDHNHVLISLYRDTNPLQEVTAGQARIVPVISDVSSLYQLDVKQLAKPEASKAGGKASKPKKEETTEEDGSLGL